MEILINRRDVNVLSTISDLFYDDDYVFGYKNGLNIAVAFTSYDTETEWILDETYGTLQFNHFSWGPKNGTYISERERLNQHNCSRQELGLEGSPAGHRFFPSH